MMEEGSGFYLKMNTSFLSYGGTRPQLNVFAHFEISFLCFQLGHQSCTQLHENGSMMYESKTDAALSATEILFILHLSKNLALFNVYFQ